MRASFSTKWPVVHELLMARSFGTCIVTCYVITCCAENCDHTCGGVLVGPIEVTNGCIIIVCYMFEKKIEA